MPPRELPEGIDWSAVESLPDDDASLPFPPSFLAQAAADAHSMGTCAFAQAHGVEIRLRDLPEGLALFPNVHARVFDEERGTRFCFYMTRPLWPIEPPRADLDAIAAMGGAEANMADLLFKPEERVGADVLLPRWLYLPLRMLVHDVAHLWIARRWTFGDLSGGSESIRRYASHKNDVLAAFCHEVLRADVLGVPTETLYPSTLHHYLAREWMGACNPVDVQLDRDPDSSLQRDVADLVGCDMSTLGEQAREWGVHGRGN